MQIVEETVTYGWPQGTSPHLVVTIHSKRPPFVFCRLYWLHAPSPARCAPDASISLCGQVIISYFLVHSPSLSIKLQIFYAYELSQP